MRLSLVFLVGLNVVGVSARADCPSVTGYAAQAQPLFDALAQAPDEASAQVLSAQLWALWTTAPDEPSQQLLDSVMARRGVYDFAGALEVSDRLVAYCPSYAEGYNQRAFIHYLRRDFEAALPDLDRALALRPRHIGALSGKALALLGLGRHGAARETLQDALELNPWLNERFLLSEGGPLYLPGTEL